MNYCTCKYCGGIAKIILFLTGSITYYCWKCKREITE